MSNVDRWLLLTHDNGAVRVALPPFARFMLGEASTCTVRIGNARLAREHAEILVDHGVSVRFLHAGHVAPTGQALEPAVVGEIYELGEGGYAVLGDAELHVARGAASTEVPMLSKTAFERLREERPTLRIGAAGEDAVAWIRKHIDALGAKLDEDGCTLVFADEDALSAATAALSAGEVGRALTIERADGERAGDAATLRLAYEDPSMRHVEALVDRAASADANVLIVGETGTGKDLVAQELVRRSGRNDAPVRVAAVALDTPDALRAVVTSARGGVLIIDEITSLDVRAQLALAHELDAAADAQSPIRVLSLSTVPLSEAMEDDRFRRELAYRLEELEIALPPLRDRREEIAPLARVFAEERGATIDEDAIAVLEDYDFPGNVRELKNVIGRAHLSSGGAIEARHLPATIQVRGTKAEAANNALSLKGDLAEIEKLRIIEALQTHKTQRDAAASLNMPMTTFLSRMDAYGIPRARGGGRSKKG